MMNCQSEACARSSSRAACASTGRAAGAAQRAVRRGQEIGTLEPPVPEQLRIEWRHDDAFPSPVGLLLRQALEEMNEVGGMPHYPLVRRRRLVRTFAAQVHVRAADAP